MKTVLNLLNNNVMKNAIKYVCALLLLAGVNVSAWGTTLHFGVNSGTTSVQSAPTALPTPSDIGEWEAVGWCVNTFSASNYANHGTYYDVGATSYSADDLYAVYYSSCSNSYCTGPAITYSIEDVSSASGTAYVTTDQDPTWCNIPVGTTVTLSIVGGAVSDWTLLDGSSNTISAKAGTTPTSTEFVFVMPNSAVNVEAVWDCPDLTKPSMNAASSITSTGATLSWSSVSGATKYTITITDDDEYYEEYENLTSSPKIISGLSPNTIYTAIVTAYNNCGSYKSSDEISFTTLAEYSIDLLAANSSGTGDGLAGVYTNATALHEITEPTKTGYTIEGYYADAIRTQKVADESGNLVASVTIGGTPWTNSSSQWVKGGDATFYTNWTPVPYTISFNANGGSGSMDGVEKDYGSTYALPACGFTAPSGKVFDGWAEGSTLGTKRTVGYSHTVSGNITFYALWRDATYTNYVFSCAELTLEAHPETADAPIFITSAAGKTVRSQGYITITGNGLTPDTELTFPGLPSKFAIKNADGTAVTTDENGAINAYAYIFYTPAVGDTDDGLDELTGITVSVEGAKPKSVSLVQSIIGRHLPANFVIAVKFADNQWYALPADMSGTGNPSPVAIRVDNSTNPTTAYCANTNAYSLYGSGTNTMVQLGMVNNVNDGGKSFALWANNSASGNTLGKNTGLAESALSDNYKWLFTQTATSVSGVGDVRYTLTNPNNTNSLKLYTNGWGFYASGSADIRLLTLSEVQTAEMNVEEWGTDAIAVSYPNGGNATGLQARIGDSDAADVTLTPIGGDIYRIATISGLSSNPAKTLTITATESGAAKQAIFTIPLIVTDAKTEAQLCSYAAGGNGSTLLTEGRAIAKYMDIVIRNGGSLTTGTGSGDFNNLYIYPGGKAEISNTFKAKNIYLRGGFSWLSGRSGESSYLHPQMLVSDGVSLTTAYVYYDLYLTGDQWYLMALPKDVAMSAVRNENGETPTTSNAWVATYSGRGRTLTPRQGGWTDQEDFGTLTFSRGVGYEIAADPVKTGRIFSTLRFPLQTTWSAETDCSPTVNSWGITRYNSGTLTANHVGWNLVGNPFYTAYQTSGSGIVAWGLKEHLVDGQWNGAYDWDEENMSNVKYYTIPNKTDYGYSDSRAASTKLDAFFPFYVQVKLENENDATLSFSAASDRTTKAPAAYRATQPNREIVLDYVLSNENSTCTSGLNISNDYSAGFDMDDKEASITKGLNELKVYTLVEDIRAAFNSLPEDAVRTIPLGYKTTAGGTHAISLCEYSDLRHILSATLTDHEEGDYEWDLMQGAYEFETTAQASGNDTRFTLRLELKSESEVPTGLDNITGLNDLFAIGYKSKIVLHGVPVGADVWTYDMTGKLVDTKRKVTSEYLEIPVFTQGIYNVRVTAGGQAQTLRTMVK